METTSNDFDPAFMTDFELASNKKGPDLLARVRTEHSKLMEVVNCFKSKVDSMVDRQRLEFVQAYEHHVQDVQKELSFLRAKVLEIKNDKTKNEKMENLNNEQKFYKKEALRLDYEANELKKKLRLLAGKIQSIENERDWLLKKLRKAKKQHSTFREKSNEFAQSFNESDTHSLGSFGGTNESQFTLDIDGRRSVHRPDSFQDLTGTGMGMEVTRDLALLSLLPGFGSSLGKKSKSATNLGLGQIPPNRTQPQDFDLTGPRGKGKKALLSSSSTFDLPLSQNTNKNTWNFGRSQPLSRLSTSQSQPSTIPLSLPSTVPIISQSSSSQGLPLPSSSQSGMGSKAVKAAAIAALVEGRARQEAIRDFIAQCASNLDKRPWVSANPRPIHVLMDACQSLLNEDTRVRNSGDGGREREGELEELRMALAVELASSPETYFALSDLFAGKHSLKSSSSQGSDGGDWGGQGERQGEVDDEESLSLSSKEPVMFGGGMDWSDLEAVPDELLVVRSCEGLDGETGLWGEGVNSMPGQEYEKLFRNSSQRERVSTGSSQPVSRSKSRARTPKTAPLIDPDLMAYLKQSESMRKFREVESEERESERREREELSYFKINMFNS